MLAPLPDGFRRQAHESLPSTNAHALAAARDGDPGRLWVTASEQTAGRGRRGRGWTTGRGNLAASLLLIDPAPPELAATISFVAAVALHQAVLDIAGPAVADRLLLKWPNDLLLDRMKVAGILVEGEMLATRRFAVVVGLGVNCVSHPEIAAGHAATDLMARGMPVDGEALFACLTTRMAGEMARWNGGSGFADTRAAWLARSVGVGERIRVNLADRAIDGRFETLDEAGRLIITGADGARQTVSAGDVFLAAVVQGTVNPAPHHEAFPIRSFGR